MHPGAVKERLIAVLDDEEYVRRALGRLMKAAGYAVATYACGADLLRSLEDVRPACLVMDLHMPGLSGFDVLAALDGHRVGMPVIAMTGDTDPAAAARAVSLGAVTCLSKPLDDAQLLAAIGAALESHPLS